MSNSVSLTRSVIGRVSRSRGAWSGIPRALPAITRIGQAVRRSSGRITLLVARREVIAQPNELRPSRKAGVSSHQALGQFAGSLCELQMARVEERGDAQGRQSALSRAQQVAGPSQLQVLLCDRESVGRALDHLEPSPSDRVVGVAQKDAEGPMRTAADPTAQLMQLGETKALRVLDEHHRC